MTIAERLAIYQVTGRDELPKIELGKHEAAPVHRDRLEADPALKDTEAASLEHANG